jgi:hypothetical protein
MFGQNTKLLVPDRVSVVEQKTLAEEQQASEIDSTKTYGFNLEINAPPIFSNFR